MHASRGAVRHSTALLVTLFCLTSAAARAACPNNAPPFGSISVTAGCPNGDPCPLNTPITFTISSAIQSCDTITWTFQDGTTATTTGTPSVTHAYTQPGRYGPTAVVTNSLGTAVPAMSPRYFAAGWIGSSALQLQTVENAGSITVTIIRSNTAGTASIRYGTGDSQNAAGTRYVAATGTLDFAPGDSSKSFSITLINDNKSNGDYDISITLSRLSGDSIIPNYDPNIHYYPFMGIHVQDDEVPPTIQFDHNSYTVADNVPGMNVVLLRSGDMTQTFSASWTIQDSWYGTIGGGGNNEQVRGAFSGPTSGTITFPAGAAQVPLNLAIRNDGLYTGDIHGYVVLYNFAVPVNKVPAQTGSFGDIDAAFAVTETQPRPNMVIDDTTVINNGPGTKNANFPVHLSGGMRAPFNVSCVPQDGTAKKGVDYQDVAGSAFFAAGQTSSVCSIPVIGRTDVQPDKTFIVNASPSCLCPFPSVVRGTATCTIINGNAALAPASVTLSPGGTTSLSVDIGQRSTPPAPLAVSSSDPNVVSTPATVSFAAGSTHAQIPATAVDGGSASVSVTLPPEMGGNVYTVQVAVPVAPSFTSSPASIGTGSSATLVLSVLPPLRVSVTAIISAADPAIIDAPSSVTIQPGQPALFTISGRKTGTTSLGAQLPARYGSASASVTIAVNEPVARISSVSPGSGPTSGGTSVIITGVALSADCGVTFGGAPVDHLTLVSATTMTGLTRFHAAGSVAASLRCAKGASTLPNAFLYVASPPSISAVTPSSGSVGGGTLTRIAGTNFVPGCWPLFGGAAARAVLSSGPTEIIATTPPHAKGAVSLTLGCGDSSASLGNAFTYSEEKDPAPLVLSVSPLSGAAGQPVTISGTGFNAGDRVSFDATAGAILSAAPDSLVVRVPEMPPGNVSVTVTDQNVSISTTGPIFTITDVQTPRITSATPATVCPGSEIAIEGSGFRPGLSVTIGGLDAPLLAMSYERAVIRVPDVASGSHALIIRNVSGDIAAAGPSVTVASSGCVAVSSITPSCATTDGGLAFTLRGRGFESGAEVTLDGAFLEGVTVVDSTTITGRLPMIMPGFPVIAVSNPSGTYGTLTGALSIGSPMDPNRVCGPRKRASRH